MDHTQIDLTLEICFAEVYTHTHTYPHPQNNICENNSADWILQSEPVTSYLVCTGQ